MTDNKNLEKQENILTDEEMDQAAGGVNQMGIVTNPCADMLGNATTMFPPKIPVVTNPSTGVSGTTDSSKSNPFPQNCG